MTLVLQHLVLNKSFRHIFDLMTVLDEKLRDHPIYYSSSCGRHESVNKIHSNSCCDTSHSDTIINPINMNPKSLRLIMWET